MMEAVPLRQAVAGLSVCDLNANTNSFCDESGTTVRNPLPLPSADTDPPGLAHIFEQALDVPDVARALEEFDIVAFKSCYSAAQIRSDEQLSRFCRSYQGRIADFIDGHPDQRFVIVSPPPRRPLLTTRAAAARARSFSHFLADFAGARSNCVFCDLFDCLADSRGMLRVRYRRMMPRDQHPNKTGARSAGHALVNVFAEAAQTLDDVKQAAAGRV